MSRIDDWNQRHGKTGDEPGQPAPIVVEAADLSTPGRVLDLASGSGRNAIYLANHGWKVVATDASPVALRKLKPIPAALVDLEKEGLPFPDARFDLIINIFFLHRPLFEEIRRVLKPGGLFAAQIHIRGINRVFCVKPGELRDAFADWEIIEYRENETTEMIARNGGAFTPT